MPSVGPNFSIDEYRSATHLPNLIWDTFRAHPCDANIMYPHAEKSEERERMGEFTSGLWITCTTSQTFATPTLDFVLSCTEGPMGSYPIFIFTTIPKSEQSSDYSFRRIRYLAQRLARIVPPERVFSVFAPDQVTRTFASIWTEETGVRIDSDPIYYAAKISYCTKRSLRHKGYTLLSGVDYDLRLARDEDLAACAELCRGFAEESVSVLEISRNISLILRPQEPFVLSSESALQEAQLLISKRQLWVHEIRYHGKAPEIASIVAVTRTSDTVAAITKVYTNRGWRQRGCAERLTRQVCKQCVLCPFVLSIKG